MERFQRFEMLVGGENISGLGKKNVIIFGLGGVGGTAAEALVRAGIGSLTLVDKDVYDKTNINRQIFATEQTVGKDKVAAAGERLKLINPEVNIVEKKVFFLPGDKSFDFFEYDYVIDAVDNVTAKLEIISEAKRCNTCVISSMGMGNRLDPTKIQVSDIYKTKIDPLSRVIRHELKKRGIKKLKAVWSEEIPLKPIFTAPGGDGHTPGSSPFVPPAAGLAMASEVVRDMMGS